MNDLKPRTFSERSLMISFYFSLVVLSLFLLVVAVGLYAFWIEPYWIEVKHFTLKSGLDRPIKIAHLSDLHTRGLGRRERKMLALLERELPDLIVISGDCIIQPYDYQKVQEVLAKLKAPLGVWMVRGNWENAVPVEIVADFPVESEAAFYQSSGVNLLVNRNHKIEKNLWLIGFNDALTGRVDIPAAMKGVPKDAYKIALFHSPVFFEEIAGKVDLALAGHTHGGQVRLPLFGVLHLPPGSEHYENGWYEESSSKMYVSRGMGNTILEIRLLSRPEIAIITLTSE